MEGFSQKHYKMYTNYQRNVKYHGEEVSTEVSMLTS